MPLVLSPHNTPLSYLCPNGAENLQILPTVCQAYVLGKGRQVLLLEQTAFFLLVLLFVRFWKDLPILLKQLFRGINRDKISSPSLFLLSPMMLQQLQDTAEL